MSDNPQRDDETAFENWLQERWPGAAMLGNEAMFSKKNALEIVTWATRREQERILTIVTDGICDHEQDTDCTDGAGFCVICAQNSIVTEIERRIKEPQQ